MPFWSTAKDLTESLWRVSWSEPPTAVVVSSLVAVILEGEVSGYAGNLDLKTFIFLFYRTNTVGVFPDIT